MKHVKLYEDMNKSDVDQLLEWVNKIMEDTRPFARKGVSSEEIERLIKLSRGRYQSASTKSFGVKDFSRQGSDGIILEKIHKICMYISCEKIVEMPDIKQMLLKFGKVFTKFDVTFKVGNINPSRLFITAFINDKSDDVIMDYSIPLEQLRNPMIYKKTTQFDL